MKNFLKTITLSLIALIATVGITYAAINIVPNGGTGVGTLTGIAQGNGTSPFSAITIGSGLSYSGGTLSATGAVSSVFGRTGAVIAQSGDYTTSLIPEGSNLYFTNARTIASTLTGYVSGSGTIASSDSILSAIQKLNGNQAALVTGVSSVSNSDGTLTISPTTGAVVASLALTHANTWTGKQTFNTTAPTFGTMTAGSVLFAGTGGLLSQNNSAFNWNDTNTVLSLGGGTPTYTVDSTIGLSLVKTVTGFYIPLTAQNLDSGTTSSTDIILGNDASTNTTNYLDLGINSSGNADPSFTGMSAGAAYLYNQSQELDLATAGNFPLKFFTGGTLTANERMRITGTGNVGIGTWNPAGFFNVTPPQYSTGTASQSGTTVTGVGTTWTAAMVGSYFIYANGISSGLITARASNTSLTVTTSQTVASQAYQISLNGLSMDTSGLYNNTFNLNPGYVFNINNGGNAANGTANMNGGNITLVSGNAVGAATLTLQAGNGASGGIWNTSGGNHRWQISGGNVASATTSGWSFGSTGGTSMHTATNTITLNATTGSGFANFNTADETTNFEKLGNNWVSNVYTFTTSAGGTGTVRNFNFTGGKVGIANTSASALLTLGTAGTTAGTLSLAGVTSGVITEQTQAAAGTFNWNLPTTAGTSGQYLTSGGGGSTAMSWTTPVGTSGYAHTIFTPTTGQTITLTNNQYNIVNPAGALLALTINLPSTPANNDVVYIKFTQTVTTVTYANGTVVDGITGPAAGGLVVLTYDSGTTSWY